MLGHISSLARATSQKYDHTTMVSSWVDFLKSVFNSKTEITSTAGKHITPTSCDVLCKVGNTPLFFPSAHLLVLIWFPFFLRDLQRSSKKFLNIKHQIFFSYFFLF